MRQTDTLLFVTAATCMLVLVWMTDWLLMCRDCSMYADAADAAH